ncbi:MAG: hypothetical protein ACTSQI_07600 [Candidatus Helarchaeota archaeon]
MITAQLLKTINQPDVFGGVGVYKGLITYCTESVARILKEGTNINTKEAIR